jgi:opacity protein-like surface antigen
MRKALVLFGLALCLSLSAAAQDTPASELFAGYSYARVDASPADDLNLHGWNASLSGNVNRWFGIVGDFAGHYARPSGVSVRNYLFLFGPRITARSENATPFVHALFGFARASALGTTERAFAMALGGGVDFNVHQNVAIRAIQADYVLTRFASDSQNNFRLSFGVVFKFGTR